MAGEILIAGVADQRTAEALSGQFLYLLAARESLPNHPALMYAGDAQGRGSVVLKVPEIGLNGYDILSATADGASVANTSLTDGVVTVTIARHSKAYEQSDLVRLSDQGLLSPQAFAQDAVQSAASTLVSLVANITDGFANTVGSTGVNLSAANFLAAIQTLEVNNVPGPYLCVMHPQQVGDLRADLAATTAGALQWMEATQAQIQMLGNGYRGQWASVDIFSTTHVPTANAGADRAGGMFGRGAVVWGDSSIPASGSPDELIIGGKVLFERDRTARAGLTAYVTHVNLGVSEGIDAAGVSIITDA
jgi:hypothetical protein